MRDGWSFVGLGWCGVFFWVNVLKLGSWYKFQNFWIHGAGHKVATYNQTVETSQRSYIFPEDS